MDHRQRHKDISSAWTTFPRSLWCILMLLSLAVVSTSCISLPPNAIKFNVAFDSNGSPLQPISQEPNSVTLPPTTAYVSLKAIGNVSSLIGGSFSSSDVTDNISWGSDPPVVHFDYPALFPGKVSASDSAGEFIVRGTGTSSIFCSSNGENANYSVTIASVSTGGATPTPTPSGFGTGAQGSLIISSNTDWTATGIPGGGFYPQFTDFTVNSGVTLTVPSGVDILCTGQAEIFGTIRVAPPYSVGTSPAPGPSPAGAATLGGGAPAGMDISSATQIVRPGQAGGGQGAGPQGDVAIIGAPGGGTFGIRAQTVSIASGGLISATGMASANAGGGGAGGVVVVVWGTSFINQGTPGIDCSGGAGGSGDAPGGGGGGGLVRLIGPDAQNGSSKNVNVSGGPAGTQTSSIVACLAGNTCSQCLLISSAGGACFGAGGAGGTFGASSSSTFPTAGSPGMVVPTSIADPTSLVGMP